MDNYILPANYLSVGYNPKNGQKFFDLLMEYYYWIREYFFSLTWDMVEGKNYDVKEMIEHMSSINTYDIPGNLLFNSTHNRDDDFKRLIPKIKDKINLKAITFLNPKLCKECKELYPDLETHVSIRYFDYNMEYHNISADKSFDMLIEDGLIDYIDVINISGAFNFRSKDNVERCHKYNVKAKYIVNEGCIVGRSDNMCKFQVSDGRNFRCTNNHGSDSSQYPCHVLSREIPWLKLAYIQLLKEMIPLTNYDILKISARNFDVETVDQILKYITSNDVKTEHVEDAEIKNYDAYLEWCEYKVNHCIANCTKCMKCKEFYDKIF